MKPNSIKTLSKTRFKFLLIIFFLLGFSFSTFAFSLEDHVVVANLSNGMKFILVRRPGAPVFAGYIQVKVGGVDESDGKTGIAHMLEHMAFKGTKQIGTTNYLAEKKILDQIEKVGIQLSALTRAREDQTDQANTLRKKLKELQDQQEQYIVKEEFSRAYTKNGASEFNATTSKDVTNYFVVLPSQQLELWAYLDSERLKDPVFREFYSERDVVMEERRMRIENSPFGKNYENLLETAFLKSPYHFPTIGYAEDVKALTATDLQNFYKTYYVPQNMVGAVVGDINIESTTKILEKYFGSIPQGSTPPPLAIEEPRSLKEKRSKVVFDARPNLMMAFHKPTFPDPEDAHFDLIYEVLCEGRTSRLHRALVEEKKIAQNIGCDSSTPGVRRNNLFMIYASPQGQASVADLEKAIEFEIGKLKTSPITSEELDRAKNHILSERMMGMQSNLGMAEMLVYFEGLAGDWRELLKREDILKSLKVDALQKTAQKYFTSENRTISILEPVSRKEK